MWEKLKDFSSIAIVPAVVLYLLGFLCTTAYLARFGIISFDIVNARFVIAGFFPLLGLTACMLLARFAHRNVAKFQFFGNGVIAWSERQSFYFQLLFWIFFSAVGLTSFFNLGKYVPAPDSRSFVFSPYGRYDFVGQIIVRLPTSALPDDMAYIIKQTLTIFCYFAAVAVIAYPIYRYLNRLRTEALTQQAQAAASNTPLTIQSSRPRLAWLLRLGVHATDVFWVALWAVLIAWSGEKLQRQTIDFSLMGEPEGLSADLFFAWLFTNAFVFFGFFYWLKPQSEQLRLQFWATLFEHPGMLNATVQQVLLPTIVAVFTFGNTIFPSIPYSVGGGEPRAISLKTKLQPDQFDGHNLFLIGESGQFLFVVQSDKGAFEINKDSIEYIETKGADTGSPAKR